MAGNLSAQRGIGFRFGSDFNYFFQADQHPLVDGWWSQMRVGPYYQAYFDNGGAQIGLNLLYKNDRERGWPNFPVIQNDWRDGQNIGITAIETDLKVGPRFGPFNPKIGYLISYSFRRTGFLEDGKVADLNRLYVALPFGLSVEGPTGYGSVGFSVFYNIGLNNVIKNPNPNGFQDYDGSKIRGLTFEFFVLFKSGKQKAKRAPSEKLPEEYQEKE
ncbi:MAG TPA: hypothetical protein ENJ82_01720 [Bacteroidetes bacterium]|nr:hypothetical protein [Bacteroidota bacterium]